MNFQNISNLQTNYLAKNIQPQPAIFAPVPTESKLPEALLVAVHDAIKETVSNKTTAQQAASKLMKFFSKDLIIAALKRSIDIDQQFLDLPRGNPSKGIQNFFDGVQKNLITGNEVLKYIK
jgi:hypothetical protein